MTLGMRTLAAAACLAATAVSANAADLLRGASYKDNTFVSHSTASRNFYVRLDGAYGQFDEPTIRENEDRSMTQTGIDGTMGFGGGIGMYFG